MKCSKCGSEVNGINGFCPVCGNPLNNQVNSHQNNINYSSPKKDGFKKIILIIMFFVTLLLIIVSIVLGLTLSKVNSRTIMIYMAGSNLESSSGIATADLESIVPSEVDLETTNVLVYTGGSKFWYNDYVDEDKNNILKLTDNGFEKIEVYENDNLGDSKTFLKFLNYGYENYEADRYDLIIYDHGLGALGSISDDYYPTDFLTVKEMSDALDKSNFDDKSKFETVIFRTCLNGTYEVASVFKDHANYMVASEEVTLGRFDSNVFSFINNLELEDDGYTTGVKFVNGYQSFIDSIDIFGKTDSTYSVIDLNEIDDLEKDLDSFFSSIDVSSNYNEISKVRANMHQYAVASASSYDYDTVDLYSLVNELKSYAPDEADEVLKDLKNLVKYNWSTNDSSNGLSVYFPYNGSQNVVNLHFEVLDDIDLSDGYYNFVKDFNNILNDDTKYYQFNLQDNAITLNDDNKLSLELTDEEKENFSKASYIIYERHDDGCFAPVMKANASLDGNTLSADLQTKVIKISNKSTNESYYVPTTQIKSNGDYEEYTSTFILSGMLEDGNYDIFMASAHLKVKDDKVYLAEVIRNEDDKEGGILIDIDDYDLLTISHPHFKILEEDGTYKGNINLTDHTSVLQINVDDGYEFTLEDIQDGKYYSVFEIKNTNNQTYYSNLEEIN